MRFIPKNNKPCISNPRFKATSPSYVVDSNGHPHIAFLEEKNGHNDIHYKYWNGSDWAYKNVSMVYSSDSSVVLSKYFLNLDAGNNPYLAFSIKNEDYSTLCFGYYSDAWYDEKWLFNEFDVDYDIGWIGLIRYNEIPDYSSSSISSDSSGDSQSSISYSESTPSSDSSLSDSFSSLSSSSDSSVSFTSESSTSYSWWYSMSSQSSLLESNSSSGSSFIGESTSSSSNDSDSSTSISSTSARLSESSTSSSSSILNSTSSLEYSSSSSSMSVLYVFNATTPDVNGYYEEYGSHNGRTVYFNKIKLTYVWYDLATNIWCINTEVGNIDDVLPPSYFDRNGSYSVTGIYTPRGEAIGYAIVRDVAEWSSSSSSTSNSSSSESSEYSSSSSSMSVLYASGSVNPDCDGYYEEYGTYYGRVVYYNRIKSKYIWFNSAENRWYMNDAVGSEIGPIFTKMVFVTGVYSPTGGATGYPYVINVSAISSSTSSAESKSSSSSSSYNDNYLFCVVYDKTNSKFKIYKTGQSGWSFITEISANVVSYDKIRICIAGNKIAICYLEDYIINYNWFGIFDLTWEYVSFTSSPAIASFGNVYDFDIYGSYEEDFSIINLAWLSYDYSSYYVGGISLYNNGTEKPLDRFFYAIENGLRDVSGDSGFIINGYSNINIGFDESLGAPYVCVFGSLVTLYQSTFVNPIYSWSKYEIDNDCVSCGQIYDKTITYKSDVSSFCIVSNGNVYYFDVGLSASSVNPEIILLTDYYSKIATFSGGLISNNDLYGYNSNICAILNESKNRSVILDSVDNFPTPTSTTTTTTEIESASSFSSGSTLSGYSQSSDSSGLCQLCYDTYVFKSSVIAKTYHEVGGYYSTLAYLDSYFTIKPENFTINDVSVLNNKLVYYVEAIENYYGNTFYITYFFFKNQSDMVDSRNAHYAAWAQYPSGGGSVVFDIYKVYDVELPTSGYGKVAMSGGYSYVDRYPYYITAKNAYYYLQFECATL